MSQKEISIRRFIESDASHASSLIRYCWESMHLGDYEAEGIASQLESTTPEKLFALMESTKLYVAERNGEIIAFGGFDKERVRLLFIHPEFQRNGIGTLLLNKIISDARNDGLTRLDCNSTIYAVPFYLKNGFTPGEIVDFGSIYFRVMTVEL